MVILPQVATKLKEHTPEEIEKQLVEGCLRGHNRSQELFYRHFYGYAMSIALRYSNHAEEAKEITNDSFIKIFNHLSKHDGGKSLRAWMRRIVINTALDRYRRNKKIMGDTDLQEVRMETPDHNIIDQLSADDIMKMVQNLPVAYRAVFNLYEIEGFSHDEVSKMLDIPVGTSKSHLARAKMKLRQMIQDNHSIKHER